MIFREHLPPSNARTVLAGDPCNASQLLYSTGQYDARDHEKERGSIDRSTALRK